MIEIYAECKSAIINNKCSECNEFYSCYICDFVEERYQQGREDATKELPTSLYCDGFNDGYSKGRADAERDFQNSDYWNDYLAKVIKDAKADAIDEYKIALHTKYKENKDFAYSVWEGNIYKYDAMANLDLEEIDEIAEQLKEQKSNG